MVHQQYILVPNLTVTENIALNYKNAGFIYTFSENADLLPQEVRDAAQSALDKLSAEANTIDFSDIVLE